MNQPKRNKDSKKENLLQDDKNLSFVVNASSDIGAERGDIENNKKESKTSASSQQEIDHQYKDVMFACMFVSHLVGVLIIGIIYGQNPYDVEEDALSLKANFQSISNTVLLFFLSSSFFSLQALLLMMKIPLTLMRLCLIFNVGVSFVTAVIGLLRENLVFTIVGFVAGAWSTIFSVVVWKRLGFVAANLRTAIIAIKHHRGLYPITFVHFIICIAWTLWWVYTIVGVVNASTINYCDDWECEQFHDWGTISLLFMSFLWTFQVIKNTLHVTVAGTVGSWWYSSTMPYKSVGNVRKSFVRAITKALGSICVGSLLMAIALAFQRTAKHLRKKEEESTLLCCAECILKFCQGVLEYFNEWAYVYVGIYGMGYVESGKRVTNLFKTRGWTTLLTDNVIGTTLFTISVVISLISGLLGLSLTSTFDLYGKQSPTEVFLIGITTGFIGSRIFMSVVASTVNAVIVCFAEAPQQLAQNYPGLSRDMNEAWDIFKPADNMKCEI